ncbi:MAG: Sec-independent protein translocase protein TatB [Rhodocyclaceae bacterium]|nr:twin-arginine translocase subunit TatB [Rhodocyclaceae bacterium]MBX3669309.1 Sec-independent protein translocase protein TatB [Rhodocyclaceae bacterium]
MFDIGFTELIVIGLVALIVLGPEKLRTAAITTGRLLGRLQRYVNDVKSEISREMQLEELKKLQQQVEAQARAVEATLNAHSRALQTDFDKTAAEVSSETTAATPEPVAPAGTAIAGSEAAALVTAPDLPAARESSPK